MTQEQIKNVKSETDALAYYEEIKKADMFCDFCKQFIHNEDYHVARNALWILTKASNDELSMLHPMKDELIDLAMTVENSSVRRLSLNIIERLGMSEEELRTDFLDFCLDRMTNLDELPGVQSLCMKLAFRMCQFYPELTDEFNCTLNAMEIDYYKPAVKSVRKRILSGKKRL